MDNKTVLKLISGFFAVVIGAAGIASVGFEVGSSRQEQLGNDLRDAKSEAIYLQQQLEQLEAENEELRSEYQELREVANVPMPQSACPRRSKFRAATDRSKGTFASPELPPEESLTVLQMTVGEGDVDGHVITVCKDISGSYWYFSRGETKPLLGVLAAAVPTRTGFRADYQAETGQPVTYQVDGAGVTVITDEGALVLPIVQVVCIEDGSVPPGLHDSLSSAGAGACSEAVTRPWNF